MSRDQKNSNRNSFIQSWAVKAAQSFNPICWWGVSLVIWDIFVLSSRMIHCQFIDECNTQFVAEYQAFVCWVYTKIRFGNFAINISKHFSQLKVVEYRLIRVMFCDFRIDTSKFLNAWKVKNWEWKGCRQCFVSLNFVSNTPRCVMRILSNGVDERLMKLKVYYKIIQLILRTFIVNTLKDLVWRGKANKRSSI